MAEFTLPLTAEGSVTAPTDVFAFTEPSAESETYIDSGPTTCLEIPEFGWALADGVNPLRLVTKGGVYNCGGLAPSAALAAASTGTKASSTATFTANAANNDRFQVGVNVPLFRDIYLVSTLDTTLSICQVKLGTGGSALATTILNIQKLIEGTGTNGVEFFDGYQVNVVGSYDPEFWHNSHGIEVTTVTGTTIRFDARSEGTHGNLYIAQEVVDSGAVYSFSPTTLMTGGVDGTGTAPSAGTRRFFYTWYRSADGAETGRSPVATATSTGSVNYTLSSITSSADTTFDFIRIYATTNLGVEFRLAASLATGTTSYTYAIEDETLALSLVTWNELLHRAYGEGMPPRGLALAFWKGSLWSLGANLCADYTKGTVAVTLGSATITFSVKGINGNMVGMTFQVAATSEQYTILSVSEGGPTAVIDRVYEGSTNGTASYKIMDDYDSAAIRRSVPFLYNQWPVDESPGRVDTDDHEGGKALLATKSRLYAFSRTSIVAVTGDGPESWEISKVGQGVGCVGARLVVGVEGGGVFLAPDGFYAISPDESLSCISSPKAPKRVLAQGIDGTVARISWANVEQGYSYFDTANRTVVFGLPLDGAVTPNYEIVFDLQNGTWTTFKRAEWTVGTNGTLPTGAQIILAGDREGNVWHADVGESDGFYDTEAVQTLSGGQTVRTLTVSGTPFSTSGDGEKGKPVIILYSNGTTVAYGKVASNTTSALTLAEDLDTAPAASDQIILGGIAWQAKSGFTTFGEEYRAKTLRSVTIRHAPTTRGEYFLSFAVNGGSFSLPSVGTGIGSLSDTDGKTRHFIQYPGDTHAINLRGFKPGGRATLRGGVFDIVLREVGNR